MNLSKKQITVCLGILSAIFFSIWLAVGIFSSTTATNYAEETAQPLEKALIEKNAVKKCSYGSTGMGPDNDSPWYIAYFEVDKSRSETTMSIAQTAIENGHKLTHASTENRGPIDAADIYIDNWYFDDTSKQSKYAELEDGPIELKMELINDGNLSLNSQNCNKEVVLRSDESQTAFSMEITLPSFKHR